MRLLPVQENERAKVACFVDELDEAIRMLRWLFAEHCKVKVAIRNRIAVVTLEKRRG